MGQLSYYSFFILSVLAIFSALMVIFSRNPIHSVLYLILCFFAISGHFLLLNAQFLFVVNIIVYAGAIMVLFLFTIMLLNLNAQTEPHKSSMLKFSAVISAGLLLLVLLGTLKTVDVRYATEGAATDVGLVKQLGKELYTNYIVPFEISSILFIAAMVGAVMLGKKEIA